MPRKDKNFLPGWIVQPDVQQVVHPGGSSPNPCNPTEPIPNAAGMGGAHDRFFERFDGRSEGTFSYAKKKKLIQTGVEGSSSNDCQ
jgi:hypothetical protein